MEQLTTVSGKSVNLTVATRVQPPIYDYLVKESRAQGVSLGKYIQNIIMREIGPKLPPASTGSAEGG